MSNFAISPAAPVFASLTITNDNRERVTVNPHQLQSCGSAHLMKLLHAVQNERSPSIQVSYENLVALRDAIHFCDGSTPRGPTETWLPVLQTAIYFNFTNLDLDHTIQLVLYSLSKTIHASLLHYVICCKCPYGTKARDCCLQYAVPVCKHNFYQMPSQHITPEVLELIADKDDLCLTSESQLAEAIISADCPHLLQHVRIDTDGQPLSSLPRRTGFAVSCDRKHLEYNGVRVEVDWQGFFFVIHTFLTDGFHHKLPVPLTCVSWRQDQPARLYTQESSHSVILHTLDVPTQLWLY